MTSVSVVIPCYNYGHFLGEAVTSVLDDQEGVDVRVLIIDDASTDGSADVARQIAARDPRVEVAVHGANRGHIATYNEGLLEWADGDYSVLMSADDRLTPGALQRATDFLDVHPGVGFVYGNVLWFRDGAPLPTARTRVRGWSVWPGQSWVERRFRQVGAGISSPEVVVRTSLQKRVGGYDARLPHVGDLEMWIRLAANADVGYLRGVDQAYYRRHGQNMSVAYTPLMICASIDWPMRRCLTVVARGCQMQRACPTSCTASWPGRRCWPPHVRTIGDAPGRLPSTSWWHSPSTAGRRRVSYPSTVPCSCVSSSGRV